MRESDRLAMLQWNAERGRPQPLAAFEILGNARACFSPDGRYLITVSYSRGRGRAQQGRTPNEIHLWEVKKREKITTLRGHDADVVHLAFSHDGALLASGEAGGQGQGLGRKNGH